MKNTIAISILRCLPLSAFLCLLWQTSSQGEDTSALYNRNGRARGAETHEDLPGDFHPYYGQRLNRYMDTSRKIAKVDFDADLNMDGVIRQNDPQDQGAFETTPPGLIIGVGEVSKVLLWVVPYRVDFDGALVVGLEICGLNRAAASGTFKSFDEEQAAVGHIRVWRDAKRKELLLDSADPKKRSVEFAVNLMRYPANLPNIVPRCLYVEGVRKSGKYLGDLRLLVTGSYHGDGVFRKDATPFSESSEKKEYENQKKEAEKIAAAKEQAKKDKVPSPPLKLFRTAFDHLLLTVENEPAKKEFVNNNAEGVWSMVPKGAGSN